MKEKFGEKELVDSVIASWEEADISTQELLSKIGITPLAGYLNNFAAYLPGKNGIYRNLPDETGKKQKIAKAVDGIIEEKGIDLRDTEGMTTSEIYQAHMEDVATLYLELIRKGFTRKELIT